MKKKEEERRRRKKKQKEARRKKRNEEEKNVEKTRILLPSFSFFFLLLPLIFFLILRSSSFFIFLLHSNLFSSFFENCVPSPAKHIWNIFETNQIRFFLQKVKQKCRRINYFFWCPLKSVTLSVSWLWNVRKL